MNEMDFEIRLQALAKQMDYPRTPDIAGRVLIQKHYATKPRFARPLAWSLTTILILLFSLFLIPPARAAILEFIQIGIVRIFPPAETPTQEIPSTAMPTTATPTQKTDSLIPLLTRLLGRTMLADVIQRVNYAILLPTYPAGLGEPDYVFVQDTGADMVILVWLAPENPTLVELSLHFIPNDSWVVKKFEPTVLEETSVNGMRAIWAEGPYPLILSNGDVEFTRLIDGHVLIWTDGDLTYRLETFLSLEDAVKIAEALEPIP